MPISKQRWLQLFIASFISRNTFCSLAPGFLFYPHWFSIIWLELFLVIWGWWWVLLKNVYHFIAFVSFWFMSSSICVVRSVSYLPFLFSLVLYYFCFVFLIFLAFFVFLSFHLWQSFSIFSLFFFFFFFSIFLSVLPSSLPAFRGEDMLFPPEGSPFLPAQTSALWSLHASPRQHPGPGAGAAVSWARGWTWESLL